MYGDNPKYIVIEGSMTDDIFIFPNYKDHSEVAFALKGFGEVVSAGFVYIDEDNVKCFGQSASLKLQARDVDSLLAQKALGFRGTS